jgi:hypothetical protein
LSTRSKNTSPPTGSKISVDVVVLGVLDRLEDRVLLVLGELAERGRAVPCRHELLEAGQPHPVDLAGGVDRLPAVALELVLRDPDDAVLGLRLLLRRVVALGVGPAV